MNQEEWEALPDENRPAVRICRRVADAAFRLAGWRVRTCAWCTHAVYVDESQELQHEVRKLGFILVCTRCVHSHPELKAALETLPSARRHWLATGISEAFRVEVTKQPPPADGI